MKSKKEAQFKVERWYEALPQDDPMQRKPDINTAEELLGWKPTVELEKGLKKTIAYFRRI